MAPVPPLLVDEMLGRLTRYLRVLGCDAEGVRGWTDDRVVAEVAATGRVLVTRDEELARRVAARGRRIRAVDLPGQLGEIVGYFPELPRAPTFRRCTVCNGVLEREPGEGPAPDRGPALAGTPEPTPIYRCASCGHRYWEGTHTARMRRDIAAWIGGNLS